MVYIIYNNVKYRTIKEFCEAFGLEYRSASRYLRLGVHPEMVIEKSLLLANKAHYKAKVCRIGDYVFASYRKAAEHFGLTHVTVAKICERTDDESERYELCLDQMCKNYRTNRYIDPIA